MFRGERDPPSLEPALGVDRNEPNLGVDVPLNDVAAETVPQAEGAFEVDGRSRAQLGEQGAGQGLGREVSAETLFRGIDGGQTRPVDGDAVASGRRHTVRPPDLDLEPRAAGRPVQTPDGADGLNQTREHPRPPGSLRAVRDRLRAG